FIEADRDGDNGAGLTQRGHGRKLLIRGATALGLELHREYAPVVDGDHVRHAGDDAEALHDRGLDGLAITPVGRMESEHAGSAAGAEMLKNTALNSCLRARSTAAQGCTRSRRRFPSSWSSPSSSPSPRWRAQVRLMTWRSWFHRNS